MTAAADPHHLSSVRAAGSRGGDVTGGGEAGPAPPRIVVGYGFWIFLISDIIVFAAFFASYAVLQTATAGGPGAKTLFELKGNVEVETALLLLSSFSCGMASLAVAAKRVGWVQVALLVTGLLGAGFLALETREFVGLVARGAGPERSAFLSGFFALVGLHGLHVGVGLLWLGTMMAQLWAKGLREDIRHRMLCFTLFWHTLDIIWVAIFTLVYIMGTL